MWRERRRKGDHWKLTEVEGNSVWGRYLYGMMRLKGFNSQRNNNNEFMQLEDDISAFRKIVEHEFMGEILWWKTPVCRGLLYMDGLAAYPRQFSTSTVQAERTPSPHDMNRQECRTKRIDLVCAVIWIPLCARDGSVIKWGRGEGETLSIHVVWTRCALGLTSSVLHLSSPPTVDHNITKKSLHCYHKSPRNSTCISCYGYYWASLIGIEKMLLRLWMRW